MYLKHIDGLRAIAVLGVMLAHYALPVGQGGFLGVDVFFVISGFLITRLIAKEYTTDSFSYKRFYLRRVRRLLPAALSVIAVCLVLFIPIFSSSDLKDFLKAVPLSILPLANVHYYSSVGYFDNDALSRPLLHFWSLAVEEQFYFIWPTVLLISLRLLPTKTMAIGWGLLIVSLATAEYVRGVDFNAAYYLLPFRAFELMVGAQLALYMREKTKAANYLPTPTTQTRDTALAWLGLALIILSFAILKEHSPLPGLLSLAPCLGTVLLIRFGAAGTVGRLLQHRFLVWVGLISYSLYLVHWPIYVYIVYRLPTEPNLWLKLLLFPLAISIAAINYYAIEKRYRAPAAPDARFGNIPMLSGLAVTIAVLILPTYLEYLERPYPLRTATSAIEAPHRITKMTTSNWEGLSVPRPIRTYWAQDPKAEKARVLLLGDSHARHLETGLVHVLTQQGLTIDAATLGGCPPLFGVARYYDYPDREIDQEVCGEASLGLKKNLASLEKYDAVILAARWFSMVEHSSFGDLSERQDLLVKVADLDKYQFTQHPPRQTSENDIPSARELFAQSLQQTVSHLTEIGKNVVVFSQVPELGNDLSRCMHFFPWLTHSTDINEVPRCKQLNAAEKLERATFSNTVIKKTAGQYGALAVIPTELFCSDPNKPCFEANLDDESSLLFEDSNHLSRKGSVDLVVAADAAIGLSSFLSK